MRLMSCPSPSFAEALRRSSKQLNFASICSRDPNECPGNLRTTPYCLCFSVLRISISAFGFISGIAVESP